MPIDTRSATLSFRLPTMVAGRLAARLAVPVLALPMLAISAAGAFGAEAYTVRETSVTDRKAVFATVESADLLHARARIGGTVGKLTVDEGAQVTAGQPLAVVGDQKLLLQLESMDARLRSLKAELAQAQIDQGRAQSLRNQGAAPQSRVDEANTAVRVLEQTIQATIKDRAVIEQQVAEGQVLAPADGKVLDVKVTDGAVVLPGEVIADIASARYLLRLRLPERHARFMRKGDFVTVGDRGLDPAHAGAGRPGEVVQVYPQLDQGRVIADVAVEGLDQWFVGERALVSVATGERRTFLVPANLLDRRWGLTYATLRDVGPVVVQTGQVINGKTEVLSGLRDGDVLIPPGSETAADAGAEDGSAKGEGAE